MTTRMHEGIGPERVPPIRNGIIITRGENYNSWRVVAEGFSETGTLGHLGGIIREFEGRACIPPRELIELIAGLIGFSCMLKPKDAP